MPLVLISESSEDSQVPAASEEKMVLIFICGMLPSGRGCESDLVPFHGPPGRKPGRAAWFLAGRLLYMQISSREIHDRR